MLPSGRVTKAAASPPGMKNGTIAIARPPRPKNASRCQPTRLICMALLRALLPDSLRDAPRRLAETVELGNPGLVDLDAAEQGAVGELEREVSRRLGAQPVDEQRREQLSDPIRVLERARADIEPLAQSDALGPQLGVTRLEPVELVVASPAPLPDAEDPRSNGPRCGDLGQHDAEAEGLVARVGELREEPGDAAGQVPAKRRLQSSADPLEQQRRQRLDRERADRLEAACSRVLAVDLHGLRHPAQGNRLASMAGYPLNGKVAFVTGAARGIGFETARQMH